ncbi:MAG: type I glyceraldehyde-3-phosphate dehydrogenase [Candidatus Pacebacteria bacterium]|nr:type I glyceraldehyde-3-phosphate dehydrogenase [Candidatus Paceibacterota bacterium]
MSKKINVAINGFGRIGRAVLKIILEKHPNLKVVAINDLADTDSLAYLLKYDSVYGVYDKDIKAFKESLKVGKEKIKVFSDKEPENLPWQELKVDVVLECTGFFRTKEKALKHVKAGAKKVIISAPYKGDEYINTVVMGVNEKSLRKSDKIVSCASCTTNCLAPVTEIIRKNFGIKKSIMTTVHAYTATQNILDGSQKDYRRGRAGAINLVPTTTGAAKATTKVIPELIDKMDGIAVRVPVPVGSLVDATYVLKKKTEVDIVKKTFIKEQDSKQFKGIVLASEEELVSSDIVGSSFSSIVDLPFIQVIEGDLLKVLAWYDNEWGYSSRLADLCSLLGRKYI